MEGVSLVAWPVEAVVVGGFALALALVVLSARRHDVWVTARAAMWGSVATFAVALVVHRLDLVPTDIPRWFYAAASLPFVGAALVVVAWRRLAWGRRALAVACVPLGLAASVVVVNQHYEYWPTLAALLGRDHSDPLVPASAVDALVAADRAPSPMAVAAPRSATSPTGRLVDMPIPGPVSGFAARPARIWLPPGFVADPDRPRPVVLFIGGTPSWTSDWTRAAALDTSADRLAAAHGGEAPILVMVDANGSGFGDTECVDGPRGRAETYLTVDVPRFVADHFAVPLDRSAWGVAGYSEGGTCAVTLALRHPDRFAAFADLAGDLRPSLGGHRHTVRALYGGSEAECAAHDPLTLLAQRRYPELAGWFAVGRDDGEPRHAVHQLADAARTAGLEVGQGDYGGGHDFGFVAHAVSGALPWLAARVHAA